MSNGRWSLSTGDYQYREVPEEMLAALTGFLAPYRGRETATYEARERSAHN
jgi:hypothetical protein